MNAVTLKTIGIPKIDIAQTIEAEKYVKCTLNENRIGKNIALARLGETRYWNAIHRAAFHWTAATMDEDEQEYGFDCRDYFEA